MHTLAAFPEQRIVRGALSATISHQFTDADGEAADPTTGGAVVSVTVTRSNGDSVTTGAVAGTGTAARTATIALAELTVTDRLSAAWKLDGTTVAVDDIEVVGGPLRSLADIRAVDGTLATEAEDALVRARRAVEDTLLSELGRSPVERLVVERLDGSGTSRLSLGWPDLREVAWARIYTSATAYTELTATELVAIPPSLAAVAERTDGKWWPCGQSNVEIAYRFGMPTLPGDIADNLILAIRHHLDIFRTSRPFLGETVRLPDGTTVGNNRPGVGRSITGNDDVDAAIRRHAFHRPLVA